MGLYALAGRGYLGCHEYASGHLTSIGALQGLCRGKTLGDNLDLFGILYVFVFLSFFCLGGMVYYWLQMAN